MTAVLDDPGLKASVDCAIQVSRYREPEPLTAKEHSAIDLALETMARWTL